MRVSLLCRLTLLSAVLCAGSSFSEDLLSPAAPYVPQDLVSGELSVSGSRTMSQLAAVWSDGLQHVHPDFRTTIDVQGSETALGRLAGDKPAIGLVSRDLTDKEQQDFATAHSGRQLLAIDAAYDAVAVIVHPENPLDSVSIEQLQVLFGARESPEPLTWGAIGLEGDWKDRPVARLLPDERSGTRGQFAQQVLRDSGQLADAPTHAWHTKIVEEVASQPGAIGVVSFSNSRTDQVRTLAISSSRAREAVALSPDSVASGDYPLIRPLTVVVAVGDQGVEDLLTIEFLKYVLSREGQADVVKDGFQPLGRADLLEQYDRLGWNQVK